MYASITVDFAGGSAVTNLVQLRLGQAVVALRQDDGVTAQFSSGITNLAVETQSVSLATGLKAEFTGTITLTIEWTSSQEPSVVLDNLSNAPATPATVTWPTQTVPQTEILTPGEPLTLSGISGTTS